jgi:predicted transcriptional regulator
MNPDTPQTGTRAGKSTTPSGGAGESVEPGATVGQGGIGPESGGAPTGTDQPTGRYASHTAPRTSRLFDQVKDQVKDRAASQLKQQKERVTARLGNVADAVRQSSQQLRDEHQDAVAQIVDRAADQLDRLSNHLRERDIGELVDDAQRLARQQPALFIGSSFAAGLLAARFIKASTPRREYRDERWRDGSAPPRGSTYGEETSARDRSITSERLGPTEYPDTGGY